MAKAGDTFKNPKGDELIFKQVADDTDGNLLELEVTYAPGSDLPPGHYHPHQEETFSVLEGTMTTIIDGQHRVYEAGETFVVPPGVPHQMHNAGDVPTRFNWQVRPALDTEHFFEAIWTLGAKGKIELPQLAVIVMAHRDEFRLVSTGQRITLAVMGPIGRLLGYKPHIEA